MTWDEEREAFRLYEAALNLLAFGSLDYASEAARENAARWIRERLDSDESEAEANMKAAILRFLEGE